MDAYLVLLFAMPIAGLLSAIILLARNPPDLPTPSHLHNPHHPATPHR
jgi:hypothetical protein